jgi:hypothetical protein
VFLESIVNSKYKTIEVIENDINRFSIIYTKNTIENYSNKSRNIQNNLYMNKTDNMGMRKQNYYTSDRINKHKSIGSTIFRDTDTIEYGIREDRAIGNIVRPNRMEFLRSSIYDSNNNRIIEEEKVIGNIDEEDIYNNQVIREDIHTYRILDRDNVDNLGLDKLNIDINEQRKDDVKNKDSERKKPVLKMESKKLDMERCLCCK